MTDFLNGNNILTVFLIAALGYLLGRIKIKGISLGTSGILIIALIFGHFGISVPAMVQSLGLASFVTAVGFIAGPKFFRNFKGNALKYLFIGFLIVCVGVLTTLGVTVLMNVKADLSLGLLTGALTTTPGLATAIEVTGSDMVSVGYGIAYPFGVISVVLFMQVMPLILKADISKEREKLEKDNSIEKKEEKLKLLRCDTNGFFGLGLAVVLGILLGKITIPLPGGSGISLGNSGGPLFMGLILGHFGHIGSLDVSVKKETLTTMREFGLAMFLIGAGTKAGNGFVEVLSQQGFILFIYGAIIALVPMISAYLVARKVFKMSLFNALGAVCGGMTSTPALGTLIEVAGSDDVTTSYAAAYPASLATMVIMVQLFGTFIVR
ncbi:MAG: hypothetical protein Q4D13_00800 [Erysipelotrichaceae bacterium]|nr:hypothetical protein [Erysipelotrichaceae bacterium]